MADQWYVGRNGQKAGPYTTEQLRQLAVAGQLVASDLLWKQGLEQWVPMTKVKGLLPAGGGGTLPPLDLPSGSGRPGGGEFAMLDQAAVRPQDAADWNPYQAGAGVVGNELQSGGAIAYADFLPRVGAYLLDAVFVGILSLILQFGLAIMFGLVSGGNDGVIALGSGLGSLLAFLITIVYFVGYETSDKQGTWGKQILGIKVTDQYGRRVSTGQAVGRFFAKIISSLTCGIGYLLPLFTDRRQTLHDLICGCLALKK